MIINHNMQALNAHRQMGANATNAQKSMEKLSSGLRINRAGDDAAGLAISEKMRGQIRGLDQAGRNAQDGISLIQTAEGALNETHSILQRMRELSVQSANDTNTTTDREELQKEINQLTEEIDRIGNTTEFNTKKLLNGNSGLAATADAATGVTVVEGGNAATGTLNLTGVQAAKQASIQISGKTTGDKLVDAEIQVGKFKINDVEIDVKTASVDGLLKAINDASSKTGVLAEKGADGQLTLKSATVGSTTQINIEGLSNIAATGKTLQTKDNNATAPALADAGASKITASGKDATAASVDLGGGAITGSGNTLKIVGGTFDGLTLKVNPNIAGGAGAIKIDSNDSLSFQIGANKGQDMSIAINDMRASALGVDAIQVDSAANAKNAIDSIQSAIEKVSGERSKLGAYQNRLEHTINNLGTSSENLTAAESRIRDVDMAKEMMTMSKNNILNQAAQAMLAQANQAPQQVLQLLR